LIGAAKGPNCTDWSCSNWADFPHVQNITLLPGQEYRYQQSRPFTESGSGYIASPSYVDIDGVWHVKLFGGNRVNFTVQRGVEVVAPLTLSPAAPLAGEIVTGQYRLHNYATRAITLLKIGVVSRGPNCNDWSCPDAID